MVGKAKWFPLHPIQLVILAFAANESGRTAVDCRKFNHLLTCFAITVPDVVMIHGEINTSSGACYTAIDLEKAFFSGYLSVMFFSSHTSLASKAGDTLTSPPQRCKCLWPPSHNLFCRKPDIFPFHRTSHHSMKLMASVWLKLMSRKQQPLCPYLGVVVKNLPGNARGIRDVGLIPGSGRAPGGGYGNPLQYSCWEILMERGAWKAMVHRVAKSQTMTEAI